MMRTLVLGLGNPLLGDDAVGLHVAEQLASRLAEDPCVEVDQHFDGGLRLMERLCGYDCVVLVDACTSGVRPGELLRLGSREGRTRRYGSTHGVDLWTALEVGRRIGAPLPPPEWIAIVAIGAEQVFDFTEVLTTAVEAAVPRAVQEVCDVLAELRARGPHSGGEVLR